MKMTINKLHAYTLTTALALVPFTLHLQAWLILILFRVIPPEYLETPVSNLLVSILSVIPPTFVVLFPFGWLVWRDSPLLRGFMIGILCTLGFGAWRIYFDLPVVTDFPILQLLESGLQVIAAALSAKVGALARTLWEAKHREVSS